MSTEYELLKKAVERKRKLIEKHQVELRTLLDTCTHEELEEKSFYFAGSYLDKAYTDHWNQCKLCGTKGPVTTDQHNHYG